MTNFSTLAGAENHWEGQGDVSQAQSLHTQTVFKKRSNQATPY